jgi:hypothetical protein
MSRQTKHRIIRAVIECSVPQHITEKDLVWHLKGILKWPLQLGVKGDPTTLVQTEIKQFGRVVTAQRRKEENFWTRNRMGMDLDD